MWTAVEPWLIRFGPVVLGVIIQILQGIQKRTEDLACNCIETKERLENENQ